MEWIINGVQDFSFVPYFQDACAWKKQVCAADRADVQNGIGIPMIDRALFVPPSKRSLRDI
jgi:hypothetical protein